MGWTCGMYRENRNACSVLVEKVEDMKQLERLKCE
jgi:hypothetical protein